MEAGTRVDFRSLIAETGWEQVVIKPTVSASSFETMLFSAANPDEAQARIDRLLPTRDLMAQPFLRSVQAYGERSLMFIDGEYTHSARRPEPFMGDAGSHESQPPRPRRKRSPLHPPSCAPSPKPPSTPA